MDKLCLSVAGEELGCSGKLACFGLPRSYMILTTIRLFNATAFLFSSLIELVINIVGSECIQKLVARKTSSSARAMTLDMCRQMSGIGAMMVSGHTPVLPMSEGEQTPTSGFFSSVHKTSWKIWCSSQ